jgi:hypothetical protein
VLVFAFVFMPLLTGGKLMQVLLIQKVDTKDSVIAKGRLGNRLQLIFTGSIGF